LQRLAEQSSPINAPATSCHKAITTGPTFAGQAMPQLTIQFSNVFTQVFVVYGCLWLFLVVVQ
jgi:hypothetical protein